MRVGIAGAGGMGNVHANQYRKMPDVELYFFEADPERRGAYAQKHQAEPAASYEELIEKVDLLDICVPTDLHLEYALKAIAAGRGVFVEKPLAYSLQEGAQLIEAAEKAGVILMPGQ